MVGGVAAQAGGAAVGMHRGWRAFMAGRTLAADSGRRGSLEAEQQALVSPAVHMVAARTVTGFAAPPRRNLLFRQLAVRRICHRAGRIIVAGHAGVAPHIQGSLWLRCNKWLIKQKSGAG